MDNVRITDINFIEHHNKTNDIDILYFPTGGGKTAAFLGILVFNLFFDRLRGKDCGVTAILKYPLRLLSVQQVQRVSNILATAERIRVENALGGESFSLGYLVGEGNTQSPGLCSGCSPRIMISPPCDRQAVYCRCFSRPDR